MTLAGVLRERSLMQIVAKSLMFSIIFYSKKCLKKAFPFNACGGMGLGGWVFCSGGQNGGQAPIVRADGRGGQGGRRLGGHLLLGLEPFHRPSLVAGWESAAWSRAKPGSHRSSCTTVASENMRGWEPTTNLIEHYAWSCFESFTLKLS